MNNSIENISKITKEELQLFIKNKGCFSLSGAGSCAISSLLLAKVLRSNNYKAEFVVGFFFKDARDYNHAFVVVGSEVIDITAGQFKLSPINIQEIKGSRYFIEKKGYEALKEIVKWPKNQNPLFYKKELCSIYKNIIEKLNGKMY